MQYDPMVAPDPEAWLALDEDERQAVVLRYHKRIRFRAGSVKMHAVIHCVVETQLAERYEYPVEALRRLLDEGLDRHDAIHAIGSVLAKHIFGTLKRGVPFNEATYERDLNALNAAAWRRSG